MISSSIAQQIHNVVIKNFGGSSGIRDLPALGSALSRPFQTFENNELYPEIFQKAAALLESIIVNHPFIDGNKRTGYVLTRLLLIANQYDIIATEQENMILLSR